ncbi:MAG TPA: LacI family DNA-binding transcriptional regulator [Chloroflexota bacterium]|jgi:LacI family transcriptional regulator|nr:LacI family DNA-binding transcriptional regulator [Chloroflexota bacterium]
MSVREIGARTGLSTSTVSLALRGRRGVAVATRQRVLEAARELGYDLRRLRRPQPARAADPAPPAPRGQRIAIVYPAEGGLEAVVRAANYGRYLRGIQSAARAVGVDLVFLPAVNGEVDELFQFVFGESGAPEGVILLGLGDEAPAVQRALTRPAPVVLLSRYVPELPCSWTSVDHVRAADLMTEHLIERGYETIAFLASGLAQRSWQRQRRHGYLNAMARHGRAPDPAGPLVDGVTPDDVARLARLVRQGGDAVAVFAAADHLALELRRALAARGLEPPRDYGLAGYDNIADEIAGQAVQLTSIGFPRERMGALALRMVSELAADPLLEQQHIVVAPELHVRASTAGPARRGPAG